MYKTRHKTACMHACLCLCTCTHKHVHTLCSLDPCGTLQPGMLRTSYLGEFRGHQLGHQLVGGSAWFPSALLGSPRGWTHGPSAIRAQTSLAMENFGSGYRGPGRDLPLWQSWRQPPAVQENTLSLWHLFQCLPYLETLMYSLNTLGQLFFP